jgi:hypothetical protein
MKRNVGGREAFLKNARQMSIVMGEEERDVISTKKGDQSISEFVRDSIRMRSGGMASTLEGEVLMLREKVNEQLHELERYKSKEDVITQEHKNDVNDILENFTGYISMNPNVTPTQQRNWLSSRCKDSCDVKLNEVLSHLVFERDMNGGSKKI